MCDKIKMTKQEAGLIGTRIMQQNAAARREEKIRRYNENPKLCPVCNKPFTYEQAKEGNKYCSRACSASVTNAARSKDVYDKLSKTLRTRWAASRGNTDAKEYVEGIDSRKNRDCPICGNPIVSEYSEYCSVKCYQQALWQLRVEEIEFFEEYPHESSGETDRRVARRYLEERCGHRCSICGAEMWNEQPIPLVVDHVDGNAMNHSVHNLRLVCPNCDAQLPTFKNRNRQANRPFRRKENKAS